MTIITGREFRANQSKYIDMAHKGERVILSSRAGYAELKPVSKEDKEIKNHKISVSFMAVASKAKHKHTDGEMTVLKSHEDIDNYFKSL